jgi:hypothetical protein
MKHRTSSRNLLMTAIAALLLAVAIPLTASAQGNGRGRGHGEGNRANSVWRNRDNNDNWQHRSSTWRNNKKCGKFVNCHDARAGRVDGRGPRGTRVGNVVWRNRLRNRNSNTTNIWRSRTRRNAVRVYQNR